MTSRFPAPWRIVEIAHGFAVDDATGRQLGVFYGRDDPNTAGHTGFLTIDEARQIAVDFARLPALLKQTSDRNEVTKATTPRERTIAHADAERKTDPKATRAAPRQPVVARESLNRPGTTVGRRLNARSINLRATSARSTEKAGGGEWHR
jgi:hypothetical protein